MSSTRLLGAFLTTSRFLNWTGSGSVTTDGVLLRARATSSWDQPAAYLRTAPDGHESRRWRGGAAAYLLEGSIPIIMAARFSGVAENAGWSSAVASKIRLAQGALARPRRFVEYETRRTRGGAPFSTDVL